MLSVALVLFGSEQETPLRVIVTVVPVREPVAVQELKPVPSVIVGDAGTVKPELKTTVQVDRAPPVWGEPLNVTFETGLEMTTAEAGFAAVVSTLVATLNVFAA